MKSLSLCRGGVWLTILMAASAFSNLATAQTVLGGDDRWDFRFGRPGLNGSGLSAVWFNDQLHLGGFFDTAGNAKSRTVVRWDGQNFRPLGSGIEWTNEFNYGSTLAVYQGELWAGTFAFLDQPGDHPALHRWDGTRWVAFGDLRGAVYGLTAVGSHLYVNGAFRLGADTNVYGLARWDGLDWETFDSRITGIINPNTSFGIVTIAVNEPEIFALGSFDTLAGQALPATVRWEGSAWQGFPVMTNGTPWSIAIHEGQLFVSGSFDAVAGVAATNIARWDGAQWQAVGAGLDAPCNRLYSLEGFLYALGNFTRAGTVPADRVARWDGAHWEALGTNVWETNTTSLLGLTRSPDGRLWVAGYFQSVQGRSAGGVAMWDGTNWSPVIATNVLGLGRGLVLTFALAGDGAAVYAGGYFTEAGQVPANHVARLDEQGWTALDEGIQDSSLARVRALAWLDGRLYVGGQFSNAGGLGIAHLAAWNGAQWETVGGGVNSNVFTLTTEGTNLYAGGEFTQAGETPVNYVARWDGQKWFALGDGLNAKPKALLATHGLLYAGGGFTTAGGQPANRIAYWDGASWQTWGSGVDTDGGVVSAIAVDGPRVYIGGEFDRAGGVTAHHVAMWDGHQWQALGQGTANGVQGIGVRALAVHAGRVYVGGTFTNAGGIQAYGLACWDGTHWLTLGSGLDFVEHRAYVHALLCQGDSLYVGGLFWSAGNKAAASIARWILEPAVQLRPPQFLSARQINVRLTGVAGLRFAVEASDNLRDWTATFTAESFGPEFNTAQTADQAKQFYRARLIP